MAKRLNVTRDQLAKFLPDQKAIRGFERLFAQAMVDSPDQQEEIDTSAESARAQVAEVAAQVARLAEAVEGLTVAPEPVFVDDDSHLLLPPVIPYELSKVGSFYGTSTITAAAINTAYAIPITGIYLARGFTIGTPNSRVYFERNAFYQFIFRCQLDKTAGGAGLARFWIRQNGVDVDYTTTQVRVKDNNSEAVVTLNFLMEIAAGSYIEFVWEVDDTSIEIKYLGASAPAPTTASFILNIIELK